MDNKKLIKTLLSGGVPQVEIAELLEHTNNNSHLEEALAYLHEAASQSKSVKMSVQVKDWIDRQEGWFLNTQLNKELPGLTPATRDMMLSRLKKEGFIETDKLTAGKYRRVDMDSATMDWWNTDAMSYLNLSWPFGLENFCHLYPGSIVVIAGVGNAGKTCMSMNFARLNMKTYKTLYFSSEMGKEELHGRIEQFEKHGLCSKDDWRIMDFKERSSNFSDVIDPEAINIIDYLEMNDNFYNVGGQILDIFNKLHGSGLAVINLQKDPKASLGRGGQFSMEKSRLYLNMDYNKLTIVKAKIRKDPAVNPNGMYFTFKDIMGGCEFMDIQRWDAGSEIS